MPLGLYSAACNRVSILSASRASLASVVSAASYSSVRAWKPLATSWGMAEVW